MMISDLIQTISQSHPLQSYQQLNIASVVDQSKLFARDAGFESCDVGSIHEDTIAFESGHQPNYIPYSGVWKKAFLLDRFREMLNKNNVRGIGYFGFLDQNTTTAPLLYRNEVPALNKNGAQKIGFSVKRSERRKRFNRIEKPPPEIWEDEMVRLENLYSGIFPEKYEISEILWSSYERANSFSDLNAFIFSRISRDILGLNVLFFRYSDIQQKKLFLNECKHILENLDRYNTLYNEVIKRENLNIRPVSTDEIPFWHHCDCGGKTALTMDNSGVCRGICPVCNEIHELDFGDDFSQFEKYYENMSYSAVSRNVIFFEGLGTHVFISGPGGGLRYGKISDAVSVTMNYNCPLTFAWSSKDYYLGEIHRKAVEELLETFSLSRDDLLEPTLNERIIDCQSKREAKYREMQAEGARKKGIRLNKGRMTGSTQAHMVSGIFSTVPSIIDLFMNLDMKDILDGWQEAMQCSVQNQYDSPCVITKNVVYKGDFSEFSPDEIPVLYQNISAIQGDRE